MLNFTDLLMGKYDHIRPPAGGAGRVHRIGPALTAEELAELTRRSQNQRDAEMANNRAAVRQAIADGAVTVNDIMDDTGLSQTTCQKHVSFLINQGEVIQTSGERRKTPYTYAINPHHNPGAPA